MPERERLILVPKFGAWLKKLREHLGDGDVSQDGVVNHVQASGIAFNRSSLSLWEHGKGKHFDASVLWLIAQLYGQPTDLLLRKLTEERARRVLEFDREFDSLTEDEQVLVDLFRRAATETRPKIIETVRTWLPTPLGRPRRPKAHRPAVGEE